MAVISHMMAFLMVSALIKRHTDSVCNKAYDIKASGNVAVFKKKIIGWKGENCNCRLCSVHFRYCRNKYTQLRIAVVGILFVIILLYLRPTAVKHKERVPFPHEEYKNVENDEEYLKILSRKKSTKEKLLLIYSTWFDIPQWGPWNQAMLDKEYTQCYGSNNCIATYNKTMLQQADALLFHGRDVETHRNDIYSAPVLRGLRKATGRYDQKWIFLAHETPQRDENMYKPLDGVFNWTATYNRNSDIFVPYGQYKRINPPLSVPVNYAKTKKYLAAWPVSNCDVKLRLNYALELEKYIPLTVYGGCGKLFKNKGECPRRNKDCHDRLGLYKFYFAFENEFCHDWMTNKYWRAIKVGSVPVVMGENFEGLAIPGSYIDVNSFSSIKALAEYLLYLDKNDEVYNQYLAYKSSYEEPGITFFCAICDKLNSNEFKKKTEVTLSERYSFANTCHQEPKRITDLERQVQESRKGRN